MDSFFALHFGSFGGTPVRWLYFVLGLSGAFLFYSGNLLWIEARRKHQKRAPLPVQQPRHIRWLAALTVGVCWGSVAGVGLALSAGKWLHGQVGSVNSLYLTVYYSVFLLALGWAFWRGPARATPHLLGLCALSAALVPVASLAAWLLPGLWVWPAVWGHSSAGSLAVDGMALLLALLFARAARASHRRAWHGPRDSVWSAHAGGDNPAALLTSGN